MTLPHGTADLVIMNPPFTRPTNHEIAEVPVPSFAGFQTSEDEQREMSGRLKGIRAKLKARGLLASHGNAGLASNFIDLAHAKIKPGGVLALVLPAVALSGGAWEDAHNLLESEYEDLTVLTIAAHGQTDRSFSADTKMAEVLVVARKRSPGQQGGKATVLFVNLYHRPHSFAEAFEMARAVRKLGKRNRQGRLSVGNQSIGTYIRAPLNQGGCASLRETTLAAAAIGLTEGTLWLPQRGYSGQCPTTPLEELGQRGLVHRDISGWDSNGDPRGPFEIVSIQGIPEYPALWNHDAERERGLVVQPDSEGEVRPGCKDQAVEVWDGASQLHFNLDFRLNSQSLAACVTPTEAIGGRAWPNFLPEQEEWTPPLVLWSNTTLGPSCLLVDWGSPATGQGGAHYHSVARLDGSGSPCSPSGAAGHGRGAL